MLLQLLSVWTLATAIHGASIISSSQQERATAPASCQEHPTNYDYQNISGHNIQSSLQNCRVSTDSTIEYMNCSTPAILTDGHHGPQLYNSTSQDHYYHIVQGETQILFTFSNVQLVRAIELYYYSDSIGNKTLPRVSAFIVNNGFTIGDQLTSSRIAEVGPMAPPLEHAGLQRQVIKVDHLAKNWVLRVDRIDHQFYLSEVAFMSCMPNPMEKNATVSRTSTTTSEPIASSTTQAASIHTTPTKETDSEHIPAGGTNNSSTATGDMLPWLLVGIVTLLFCGLLSANVICCIVCIIKRHKKSRYELKRNPSYLPSPRVVGTQNNTFDNHIYDVPTS